MISNKTYAWILIVTGLVGMATSFTLTLDKIELLKNPAAELPCNINPLISCGPVINTPQASAFGFPNPLLGLAGFAGVFTTGLVLLAGATPNKKYWKFFVIGTTFAIGFVHFLISQSVFVIGALCLYCMITWAAVWPLFLYSLLYTYEWPFLKKNHLPILISWYLLIILVILFRFRDFFFN